MTHNRGLMSDNSTSPNESKAGEAESERKVSVCVADGGQMLVTDFSPKTVRHERACIQYQAFPSELLSLRDCCICFVSVEEVSLKYQLVCISAGGQYSSPETCFLQQLK